MNDQTGRKSKAAAARALILSALDMATRPLLVPCYLLLARLSVTFVRRRRAARQHSGEENGNSTRSDSPAHQDLFPGEAPTAPAERNDWPSVSIVIPVLDAEKTIGRCLESIRGLDYPAGQIEVIVADNGSTDRTVEIARERGVQIVVEPRRGAAAARNAGIAASGGEWIAVTDDDCVLHPLWLKHLVATALDGGHDAVGGRIVGDCDSGVVREFCAREGVLNQQGAVEGRLLPFPFIVTANGLYRREALTAIGGFDETFAEAAAEDVDLGWRLGENGVTIGWAPDAWVSHRQRERAVDVHGQYYRYGFNEVRLYLKHRHRFTRRELSRHLWIRPILYRHFLEALWRWATARQFNTRHLWRLVLLKELGHMAGKMDGHRRWGSWRYFRLWTRE